MIYHDYNANFCYMTSTVPVLYRYCTVQGASTTLLPDSRFWFFLFATTSFEWTYLVTCKLSNWNRLIGNWKFPFHRTVFIWAKTAKSFHANFCQMEWNRIIIMEESLPDCWNEWCFQATGRNLVLVVTRLQRC